MSGRGIAYVLLVLTALFWSGNVIVARAVHEALPPLMLASGRWVLAFSVLLVLGGRRWWRCRAALWRQKWRVLALSVTGIAGYNTLLYTGLQETTATHGALLNSLIPIMTVLVGAVWFRQRLLWQQVLGVLISFVGVLTIVSNGELARVLEFEFNRGDLWVCAAVGCWALYTLLLRGLSRDIDGLALLLATIGVGLWVLLPLTWWQHAEWSVWTFESSAWWSVGYVGIFPSVLAYWFYNHGVSYVGPARASAFIHLMPVFTPLIAWWWLHEQLHHYHALGMCAIFLGLFLSARSRN